MIANIAIKYPEPNRDKTKVVLNAYHEGGHIIIQIKDDGRGIIVEKLRAKMVSSGIAQAFKIITIHSPSESEIAGHHKRG